MKIRAIITGATGMVGEGVLHECLQHTNVEQVLIINRRPSGMSHPKLKEIVHTDFFDLTAIEGQLTGYNACFFCLGVSSVGMKEADFHHVTYDLATNFAGTVARLNPDMTFCYVSGRGTDSTEQGRSMWARVKGKTENHIAQLPFRKAYMFRPGYMQPTPGLKNTLTGYKLLSWLHPVWKALFPKYVSTLKQVGLAMINIVNHDPGKTIIDVPDIIRLAEVK